MTVVYDRKAKTYISNITPGSWLSRLDAELAELPPDLVERAEKLTDSLKVALKAVRLIQSNAVEQNGQPDIYFVKSQTRDDLHFVDLGKGCDCDAFQNGIICSHWVACLLVASSDDNEAEPVPEPEPHNTCNDLIEELFGPPCQVYDKAGRVVFG